MDEDEIKLLVEEEVSRRLAPLRLEIADLRRRVEILEAQKAQTLAPCMN